MMSSDAALLREIEQLAGAINHHKAKGPQIASSRLRSTKPREVVINGAAYDSSKRKLIRKDAPVPTSQRPAYPAHHSMPPFTKPAPRFPRAPTTNIQASKRVHKPKIAKLRHRNMVLDNTKATSKTTRAPRQCRFFSISGLCTRGLTCRYQHDPAKVAICPRFLSRDCPLDASSCPLSHEPTPERVPLCVHFANNGRCKNGDTCLYPHVNVGKREGVCRDFAVLGYCDKGVECDKQHVHECPDFAEKSVCLNRQCKLPHVIRATRKRQGQPATSGSPAAPAVISVSPPTPTATQDFAMASEEFIPLTFHESSEDDEESDSEDDDDDLD